MLLVFSNTMKHLFNSIVKHLWVKQIDQNLNGRLIPAQQKIEIQLNIPILLTYKLVQVHYKVH